MSTYLSIFIGGGLGAICRYLATGIIATKWATAFPFGTLFVNIVSCFCMGAFMEIFYAAGARFPFTENIRLFVAVGFLGGFSTFAAFSIETIALFQESHFILGVMNIVANNLFVLLFAALGWYSMKFIL